MYKYKVIKANEEAEAATLASMHNLRWNVFHNELKWRAGLILYNCMEFDKYDTIGAYYIVRVNEYGDVDVASRVMPTTLPYMLEEEYSEFVQDEPIPKSDDWWEISRTCASREARKSSNGKITAEIITAAIEFGLVHNVKNYISLSTDTVYPMLKRSVGWDSKPLGPKLPTPDDLSYSLKHSVTFNMLQHIRKKNNFTSPFIYSFDENINNIKELWHDNSFIRENTGETYRGAGRLPPENNVGPILP